MGKERQQVKNAMKESHLHEIGEIGVGVGVGVGVSFLFQIFLFQF